MFLHFSHAITVYISNHVVFSALIMDLTEQSTVIARDKPSVS